MWYKAVLRGKPDTDRDPCRASTQKLRASHGLPIWGPCWNPLTGPPGARELSPTPQEVGSRGRLPPPCRRKPKLRQSRRREKTPAGVYVFICLPPDKMWHKAVLRGKPGTDRDPCRACSKIACFLWTLIRGAMKVHGCTRVPSPHKWSAAEAAYLHPAVAGRSTATKPEWSETTVGQK